MIKLTMEGNRPVFVLVGQITRFRQTGAEDWPVRPTSIYFTDGSRLEVVETAEQVANAILEAHTRWNLWK